MKNLFASVVLVLVGTASALENGLGRTPQMGWNTWNKFACNVNETLIKRSADKIVELGLDKLGYKYVNIDDCWMLEQRDANGHMVPDPVAFPSGMKSLGDYIHNKGLKFGIYSSAGNMTCEKRAGSLHYEDIDAQDWADWGVDYLKYDNCFNEKVPAIERYPRMRDALLKTGRPIFYSVCNWGYEDTWKWGPETGNSWRTTMDIKDIWASVQFNFRANDNHHEIAKPGAWNDPDMLEIGNGGLTNVQEKTHFALWAVAKAPLILGCDLDTIKPESFEIITNKELIEINQDPLGVQAHCRIHCSAADLVINRAQVYAGPLANGDVAAVIVNWGHTTTAAYEFDLKTIGADGETYIVRDLWKHEDVQTVTGKYKVEKLPAFSSLALRFKKVSKEII